MAYILDSPRLFASVALLFLAAAGESGALYCLSKARAQILKTIHHLRSVSIMVSTRRKNYGEGTSINVPQINLLDLPEEILIKILSYLKFEYIVDLRLVSVEMNRLCAYCLNSGFQQLTNQFATYFITVFEGSDLNFNKYIKLDIILNIMIDLVYLRKTIGMFIEQKDCIFFCGQIIDKGYVILQFLSKIPEFCVCIRHSYLVRSFHKSTGRALQHFNNYIKPIYLNLRSSAVLRKK